MKAVPFLAMLLLAPMAHGAADTAYTALRVVGKSKGESTLNRVVELRGRGGTPEPAVWKVVLDEPSARGGVREFDVQRGQIIGERAPAAPAGDPGPPMNFTQLNLDSEGAFTVANQEMQQARIPFDRIDYTLRSGNGGGAPVWRLELFDGAAGRVGTIEIAADTGAILQRNTGRRPGPPVRERRVDEQIHEEDRDFLAGGGNERRGRDPVVEDRGHSRPGEPFRGVDDFFYRLGKRFERRGRALQNFFTGRGGSRESRDVVEEEEEEER
jgi:hypothetical protein